jgi:3',5'-cyclic AMP phosphodiesterase CpdA
VRTDSAGRYELPARPGEFVQLTCPADHVCDDWYRAGPGDFALRPSALPDDFFFIQISDAHVFSDPADFARYSSPPVPWWMPQIVADWLAIYVIDRLYPDVSREQLISIFRDALPPERASADLSDIETYRAYGDAIGAGEIPFARSEDRLREAFAELRAMAPEFVISTGDLWLESNNGTPEAIERWIALYEDASTSTGLRFYNTIGNNEVAGTENDEFPRDDPRYGKHYFRATYGPTAYSFDRGPFHFVALDTHTDVSTDEDDEEWDFYRMDDPVRTWAAADLGAHRDRVLVALNHEPFHYDTAWGLDEPTFADDAGLFVAHDVRYSIAGHIHKNGFEDSPNGPTHITTGALSGMRWMLPPELHPRGYRLFYAHEGQLFSAWKVLGKPALGFVTPRDPAAVMRLHPASRAPADPSALTGVVPIVMVAADARGPFRALTLELDSNPVALSRWGRYFAAASIDASKLPEAGGKLTLHATRSNGESLTAELQLQR